VRGSGDRDLSRGMVVQPSGRRSILVSQLTTDRAGTPQQVILDELRRVILDGGAPPGTSIPLGEVAELFGVSPIPVREALKTLVGENLVAHRPNAGYVVAQLTRQELTEIYLVRGVLESAALRAAVEEAGDEDIERAADAQLALEQVIENWDPRAYHRESRRFHLALIAPCRMRRLLHMFESAWNVTEPFQPMRYIPGSERERLHADHQEMLAAFIARDAAALVASSGRHHQRLESVIALLPEQSGLIADPG
jgi:DNA-binding GntR family transcriptional regulator